MKKFFTMLFFAFCAFASSAFAGLGPTKDIIQLGQGEKAANEYCKKKYSDDVVMTGACVMVIAGGVVSAKSNDDLQLNVRLEKPVPDDVNRPAGKLMKCRAEMVILSGNNIGWKETPDCDYR